MCGISIYLHTILPYHSQTFSLLRAAYLFSSSTTTNNNRGHTYIYTYIHYYYWPPVICKTLIYRFYTDLVCSLPPTKRRIKFCEPEPALARECECECELSVLVWHGRQQLAMLFWKRIVLLYDCNATLIFIITILILFVSTCRKIAILIPIGIHCVTTLI